jgi:replicative DNA helicase
VKDPLKVPQQIIDESLTLAIFDKKFLSRLVKCVTLDSFKPRSQRGYPISYEVAKICYKYYQENEEAPAHYIGTLLLPVLEALDSTVRSFYLQYTDKLFELFDQADSFNREFLLKELKRIAHSRTISKIAQDADQTVLRGDLEKAREKLLTGYKSTLDTGELNTLDLLHDTLDFSTDLFAVNKVLNFDIPLIDSRVQRGIQRGELVTIMAGPKVGKTWFLTYLGENACWYGKKVLHITCELSKIDTAMRYTQMIGWLTNHSGVSDVDYRLFDDRGRATETRIVTCDTVQNSTAVDEAKKALRRGGGSIKVEYMSSASLSDIHSLLTLLDAELGWRPDLLIVDYVEMMKLDSNDRRNSIFETYKGLRDIANEYNLACITASQPNRTGMDRRIRSGTALAEDIRKAAVSDMIIAISPIDRDTRDLWFLYNRAGEGEFGCEFSICYKAGQVAIQSWPIQNQTDTDNSEEVL